jgi:hypothetical protein
MEVAVPFFLIFFVVASILTIVPFIIVFVLIVRQARARRQAPRSFPVARQARAVPVAEEAEPDYECPNCGASVGEDSEISPSGDIKCAFCKSWFNVYN